MWLIEVLAVFKEPLRRLIGVVLSQWKGAAGIAFFLILYYAIFIKPTLDKYYEVGTFVGDFAISKGERVTVSLPDLSVEFDERILRTGSDAIAPDTSHFYPQINVYRDRMRRMSHPNFDVGRRLSVTAVNYIYTIELKRLDEAGVDTVAHVTVHRREYPETRRDDK